MPFIGRRIRKGAVAGSVLASCALGMPGVAAALCPETAAEAELAQRYLGYDRDKNWYFQAPGGSFAALSQNWYRSERSSASTTGDTIPGVGDRVASVRLRPGAWVSSRELCVDQTRPHFRFSARFVGGVPGTRPVDPLPLLSSPATKALAQVFSSATLEAVASLASAKTVGRWRPWFLSKGKLLARVVEFTPQGTKMTTAIKLEAIDYSDRTVSGYATLAPHVNLGPDGMANVRLYFYAPTGTWQVDSVYVDPYSRR